MSVRVIRWKGFIPLGLVLGLVAVVWFLLLDPLVEWSVESAGTEVVGARVDVAEADVRPQDGVVLLRRLEVTNPDRPMTNLVEADEIVVNFRVAPLLEKKVIIDTVALRGVRFGTPRQTSGALRNPPPGSGRAMREARAWADQIRIPSFSLQTLQQVVNLEGIRPESLETLRRVRALPGAADSLRAAGLERLQALNPRPTIDSAAALAARLEGASLRTLGLTGARDALRSARGTIDQLTRLDDRLREFEQGVTAGVTELGTRVASLEEARRLDYAYARGLLRVPSLEAPDLAPALFGDMAVERLVPLLAWVQRAEHYLPPGLERQLRSGPDRVRARGTTVLYPRREQLPKFLLRFAEASLAIGGTGAAAGDYTALITGVTSAPAVYGQPMTFAVERARAAVGPRTIRAGGILNHVGRPVRDSAAVFVAGIALPTVDLAPVGARLALGQGTTDLLFRRVGDSLDARWSWRSEQVEWTRPGRTAAAPAAPPADVRALGRQALASAEDIAWRALTSLRTVEVTARLTGPLARPRVAVQSNVAQALAAALRDQLGQEIRRLEQDARARVDALVQERVVEARAAVGRVETDVAQRVADRRRELAEAKTALEARVRELARIPGIGP